jgi:uncharacterized membrane protein YdjX (TVP38/TMEM64 family)
MANDIHTTAEPSVTSLVSGIAGDFQSLIQQQVMLVRQEIQEDLRKTKEGATSFALAAAVTSVSAILIGFTAVYALGAATTWPLWGCFAIVAGVFAAAAAALIVAGMKKFDSISPLHDQAIQGLKENLEWKTNPH